MSAPSISPIRFSVPADLATLTERLNKAMRLLELELQGLQDKIAALQAPAKAVGKPGYPGIANGSAAIIPGPAPGGPSPVPPYITPHTRIVGEGSTPVKLILGNDGQIPIACAGNDPAFANITGDSTAVAPATPRGIVVINGCNTITLTLGKDVIDFLEQVASILGIIFG